jgi:GNAT superfamily N-acetyltransferase
VGLVAEVDGRVGGFLLGRVGEWDSIPPITRPGRVGLVDVVCVAAELRGRGVGSRLAAEAVGKMEAAGAERIETTYDPGNPAAARLWERMGFRPSLRRAWRPGGP